VGLQKIISWYVPQGVFVITSKWNDKINGMTAAWVSQVSFKPRLLAVAIAPQRYTYELIKNSGMFCINVLGKDQIELAKHFGFKSGKNVNKFENISATIYGGELSASVYATDELTIDMGVSYKRGKKDTLTRGQSDKDLADMAPLRGNIVANYEYMANSFVTAEIQASDKWSDYDEDNGEQELDAWSVVNLKVKHAINKSFDFTLGVNNLFDETYAQSNTYADLILIQSGASDTMLLNEMGRYVYTNLDFRF